MKKKNIRSIVEIFPEINWNISLPKEDELFLKWGECPVRVPKQITNDIAASLVNLNRYPTGMESLRIEISKYTGLDADNICITNGSDKAFRLLAEVFIEPGDEIITFCPSYPVIDSAVMLMEGKVVQLPLTTAFCLPSINKIRRAIQKNTKLIYICNPNNPTGNLVATVEEIERIAELGVLVVVDEAYFEVAHVTVVPLLKKYQNIIVLRSFSKGFALAGLRVGYVLASPSVIQSLKKIEETLEIFNVSSPSLVGAISALRNRDLFIPLRAELEESKKKLRVGLTDLGFEVFESKTTFLLFDTKKLNISATEFCERMKQEKILLKNCAIYSCLDEWKVYTAIPSEKDLERFLKSAKKVSKERKDYNTATPYSLAK